MRGLPGCMPEQTSEGVFYLGLASYGMWRSRFDGSLRWKLAGSGVLIGGMSASAPSAANLEICGAPKLTSCQFVPRVSLRGSNRRLFRRRAVGAGGPDRPDRALCCQGGPYIVERAGVPIREFACSGRQHLE